MAISKIFTHGIIKGSGGSAELHSFLTQPTYTTPLKADEIQPTELTIGETKKKNVTTSLPGQPVQTKQVEYIYPEMNGIAYDPQFVCTLNGTNLINTDNFEFCPEPPKALMHPDPAVFTLKGPYYFGLTQPAVYNEFVNSVTEYAGGQYVTTIISLIYDHMQVYYIPTDPILTPEDELRVNEEKTLLFHYKGILTELEAKNSLTKEELVQLATEDRTKYIAMSETTNGRASLLRESSEQRQFLFTTKAQIGTFRLSVKDNYTKPFHPAKTDLAYRTDKSIVIKMWPRTLPVQYQMNTDGALQHVGFWTFTFSPMPKPNYNLRFFNESKDAPEQLNLLWPIDPQSAVLKIQKIDPTVTGANEIDEVNINVHFWRLSYNGQPYIPKTINYLSTTTLNIDGVVSRPVRFYTIATNTAKGEKPAIIKVDRNDPDKHTLVAVAKGKFKLVVMDGSFLAYVSSEIEVT
jgi:hypothetical protein